MSAPLLRGKLERKYGKGPKWSVYEMGRGDMLPAFLMV
jgi:hypothetical protein